MGLSPDVTDWPAASAAFVATQAARTVAAVTDHTKAPLVPVREGYTHPEPVVARKRLGGS